MRAEKIGATRVAEAVVATMFPIPRNLCVANVSWSLLPYEADLLVLTQSGYLIEVEVKVSLADLKRDADKAKWRYPAFTEKVSKFYYAMPDYLWNKQAAKDAIRPGAGVLVVTRDAAGYRADEVVPAVRTCARKLTPSERFSLARVGSFRAWSPQQKHRRRQILAEAEYRNNLRKAKWDAELNRRQQGGEGG